MLYGFDLNRLFYFPIENKEARKNFLIGALLILASFIIPIIPYLLVIGYLARIMRQVINGEKPHMTDWDDWETLFKDGAKLFGVRLIYSLPLLLLLLPIMLGLFVMPILASMSDRLNEVVYLTYWTLPLFVICLLPLSLSFSLIIPVAEAHVVAKGSFSAGFRIGEWWAIFRKNIGGFVVAFMIFYGTSMLMSIVFQIIFMTIILICLLPLILPVYSMYMSTIMYTTFAQAYREGREKLGSPVANHIE